MIEQNKTLGILLKYIAQLEAESFECWEQEAIDGYLTAMGSIKAKIKEIACPNCGGYGELAIAYNGLGEVVGTTFCPKCVIVGPPGCAGG